MPSHTFLVLLGGLIVLAFLAEEAYARLRLPPVLALVACGLVLGPATGAVPVAAFTEVAPHFGALAFLLILFEGGLDLELDAVVRRFAPGLRLAVAGFVLAFLAGLAAFRSAGSTWAEAAAAGIALAPVSGAIVIPLASRIGFRREVRTLVTIEAALADVLGVLAMAFLSQLVTSGGLGGVLALGSLLAAGFSVLLSVTVGLVWPRVLRGLGERRFMDALTFGLALLLWGAVDAVGASGALAVLAFGVTLANEEELLHALHFDAGAVPVARETVAKLHGFVGELTFVVRAFFFVFLGAVVRFDQVDRTDLVLVVVVVAASIGLRRLVLAFMARRGVLDLTPLERRAVWLLQPRGLVSAVLALEAAHLGLDGGGALLGAASLVIIATNLIVPLGTIGFGISSPERSSG